MQQLVRELNRRPKYKNGREYIGKLYWLATGRLIAKIDNLPVSDADKRRLRGMSPRQIRTFLSRKFKVWGCDGLVRESLILWSKRKGGKTGYDTIPRGEKREIFLIAKALQKQGWKTYLLDYHPNLSAASRRRKHFERLTKVQADDVLSKSDIDGKGLDVITTREYYFGMEQGVYHSFIGTKDQTFHGSWSVFPGRKSNRVNRKQLLAYVKRKPLLLIVVPPLSKDQHPTFSFDRCIIR